MLLHADRYTISLAKEFVWNGRHRIFFSFAYVILRLRTLNKKKKTFSMSPTYKSRRALYAYNFFVGHAVARRKLHQSCHRFSTNRNLNLKHKVFSGPLTVMAGEKLTRSHRLAAALVILITNFPN